jgi:LPXTG-motif cell wall-anchored protein
MRILLAAAFALASTAAWAQSPPAPAEGAGEPISTLMFFTLGGGLVIAVGLFLWFLRKRSNRAAAERVFTDKR